MNARRVALGVLEDVEQGAYFNLALKRALGSLSEQDRRFVSALCFTTLENLYRIDYVIGQYTQGKRIHRMIRNVLRLGVCQLMFFESVPQSAAVNESVKLVQKTNKPQFKGFVNAVLRKIAGAAGRIEYPDLFEQPVKYLSVFYSYPAWLVEKYIADYGRDFAEAMLSFRKTEPDTCVRANLLKTSAEALEQALAAAGLRVLPGKYVKDARYVKNMAAVDRLPAFIGGEMAVQSEASMLVVRAAQIRPSSTVLDVCAAPGGKTAYAAQFTPASLTALELHPHREELMRKNFERLGVRANTLVADASVFDPALEAAFDRVLVDAPCSALGLAYRKPDIKYVKTPAELAELAGIQQAILQTCAHYVKPGGRLIYSTCTINRAENDENLDQFLQTNPDFAEAPLADALPAALATRAKNGRLQLFPHLDGVDGFYIAALEKQA